MANKEIMEVEYMQYKKNDYASVRECQRLVGPSWTVNNGQHGFTFMGSKVVIYENEFVVRFPNGSIDVFKPWTFCEQFKPISKPVPVINEPTAQVKLDIPLAHNPKDPYQISLDDIMKAESFSIDALARQMANGNHFGARKDGR